MWKREKQEISFRCPIFTVTEDTFRTPEDKELTRYSVRHPGAVVFLPITDSGTLLLVKQYRASIDQVLLEAPAGTLEVGESPLECAKREIQEEVGFAASEWTSLGGVYPAPGFCDEYQHLFVAKGLTPSSLPADDDEDIEVVECSTAEIDEMVSSGELTDSKTLSLLLRYELLSRG